MKKGERKITNKTYGLLFKKKKNPLVILFFFVGEFLWLHERERRKEKLGPNKRHSYSISW